MNDKNQKLLERIEEYLYNNFRGYCIGTHVSKNRQTGFRGAVLALVFRDESRLMLSAHVIDDEDLASLFERLEVYRHKLMMA